uniref:Ig-like domain-containing protein n=1 Tax=Amphilophus citrinellus TaxID=61819 RepID=A0A3Q0RZ37_AMPCI
MEAGFLTFIVVSIVVVYSCRVGITDWDDVVVVREGMLTTLVCNDATVRGGVTINWKVKLFCADEWKLIISATENEKFSGGALKPSMQLTDPNFQDTGVFSLSLKPEAADIGFYSCLIKQQERKLKEKIILLAILTGRNIFPAAPIPQHSTLRLIANVTPDIAFTKVTWAGPGGVPLMSKKTSKTDSMAKLPQVLSNDGGVYVCMVYPRGNGSSLFSAFNVDVVVAGKADWKKRSPMISTATQAHTSFPLTCPGVQGDYVQLHWLPPDSRSQSNMKSVYQYDRWRGTLMTDQNKRLQMAGPPYNPETGSFSFLLTPDWKDGGLYICEVLLNDNIFSQRTLLTVLKVKTKEYSRNLELVCLYSERSQVRRAEWKHHNKSRKLNMSSSSPGTITTILPLPITSDIAGNYTCVLYLKNGQVIQATQAITVPAKDSVSVTTPSLLPSLSALLLLVPLVAAAVGVLLWRQKHISDRGIEQSLSVQREAENIYENPEDIRQDLKPRGEDDVYKELER